MMSCGGEKTTNNYLDTSAANQPSLFYRVRLVPYMRTVINGGKRDARPTLG
jgi:hypothetical protein